MPCIREKRQTIGPEASYNLRNEKDRSQNKDKAKSGFALLSRKHVTVVVVMMIVHEAFTYDSLNCNSERIPCPAVAGLQAASKRWVHQHCVIQLTTFRTVQQLSMNTHQAISRL